MLKAIEKLVQAVRYGKKKATFGNHWMEVQDNTIKYFYHNTAICVVKNGKATYDNGGWNTSSTTRAINSYKAYYGE